MFGEELRRGVWGWRSWVEVADKLASTVLLVVAGVGSTTDLAPGEPQI
jgi:hypothetical protein